MKIILINTPYVDIYGPIKNAVGRYFPLGIGYIGSFLKKNDHEVLLLDPEAQNLSSDNIADILKKERPDVVGISSATPNFPEAIKLANFVKGFTDALIVLGGAHASALPKIILEQNPSFDLVVKGEGEYTMLEIMEAIKNNKSFSIIKGLAYRNGNEIIENDSRAWITDVDKLPFPDRDQLPMNLYRPHAYATRKKNSAAMISTRGCPNRCTFCASNLTLGRTYRPHSPEYTFSEIEMLVKNYGIEQIIFHDDTFTVSQKRVEDLCRMLIKNKMNIVWSCFARVNTVNRDLLKTMKEAGCFSLSFGIESGDEGILKTMQKDITLEKARMAMNLSHELGFKTLGFFILGTPGETKKTIQKTVDFSVELSPTLAFFNILVPFPGTKVFKDLGFDEKKIKNWKDFIAVGVNPALLASGLKERDLTDAVRKAYLRFYLRPKQLLSILKQIRSWYEIREYLRGFMGLMGQLRKL